MTTYYPAIITSVVPGSVADEAGLRPGDRLLAIDGVPLRDVIDVQILTAEPEFTFIVERRGRRLERYAERRYGQPLGLNFADLLFDGAIRRCRNNCEFCFVTQMPPGMRSTLYVKDDDYRLSFLHGNYVTLTNLAPEDWERIEEQYLSPLYVSIHATEPGVRVGLMANPAASPILEQLERLVDAGVEIHTQAVLVPGRNDGPHLDRTVADLAELHPGVVDLSVVPVGLTRHHAAGLRPYTDAEAAAVLEQLRGWQERLREELGVAFVYPSDEWYLRAGKPVPPLRAYDGLLPALIENGVGMVRRFTDAREALFAALAPLGGPQSWITGTLFAPLLGELARDFTKATGVQVEVIPIANRAFGETVTVAGLLTVGDVLAALEERSPGEVIVMPEEIFRGPERQALDEGSVAAVARATGRRVVVVAQEEGRWVVRDA